MFEIKFTIDLADRAVRAIEQLTQALANAAPNVQVIEQLTQAPKVETPKVETPKVEAPKVEAPKVEAPKVDNGGTLKIEELRALLRVKVNNDENRGKLKAKLESLGASNVTTLAKEHYTEFYNFMNTLP
jgi:hypothetical protein